MIKLQGVSKIIANEYLFENISCVINDNDRVGIVGKNGIGKSTLLKIIKDNEYGTDGEIQITNKKVAFLSQENQFNNDNTIDDEVKFLLSELKNIQRKMKLLLKDSDFATNLSLIKEYGELDNRYQTLGGYEREAKIYKMLSQFGFKNDMLVQKISSLSGGEKTRLALVKILLSNPDCLILDEPTNHLDIKTIEWLEEFLISKVKTLIVVSHDRFFLQRVCTRIFELRKTTLDCYNCKYDDYVNQRKMRVALLNKTHDNQIKEIQKLNEFIKKNQKKDSKIGQVNDRKKKLDQIKPVELLIDDKRKLTFTIEGFKHKKANYVEFIDCDIGYEKALIKDVNLIISGGNKIGIVGENGSGKTTLINTMIKKIKPVLGSLTLHPTIKIGFFEQEQRTLVENETIYDQVSKLMPLESKTMVRKHLANFLFFGDDVFKTVKVLSGGEKMRFVFSLFALKKYDMIILDEPTNHLDISAKEELEQILKQYKGTIILISHDRYFLNAIINRIMYISHDHYDLCEGNYFDYLENKVQIKKIKNRKVKNKSSKSKIIEDKKIERNILNLETKITNLNELCLNKEIYGDFKKMKEIDIEIKLINEKLEELYYQLMEE